MHIYTAVIYPAFAFSVSPPLCICPTLHFMQRCTESIVIISPGRVFHLVSLALTVVEVNCYIVGLWHVGLNQSVFGLLTFEISKCPNLL